MCTFVVFVFTLCLTQGALFKKIIFGLKSLIVNGESDLKFNGFSLVTFDLVRAEILKFNLLEPEFYI